MYFVVSIGKSMDDIRDFVAAFDNHRAAYNSLADRQIVVRAIRNDDGSIRTSLNVPTNVLSEIASRI